MYDGILLACRTARTGNPRGVVAEVCADFRARSAAVFNHELEVEPKEWVVDVPEFVVGDRRRAAHAEANRRRLQAAGLPFD